MKGGTAAALCREAAAALRAAGIEGASLDARLLLAHALGLEASQLVARADDPVPDAAHVRFAEFLARRAAGEPVARILGAREFWSRTFALSPQTLVPRPESETVIEAALEARPGRDAALRILDLGAGTGCLLGALLLEYPAAMGVAVEIDPQAAQTARANLVALGVGGRASVLCGDWGRALAGRFDLVVSNPPYVAQGEIAGLPVEVRAHDPSRALDGGEDGLDAYRAILVDLGRLIAPGGIAVLELGAGQERAVADLARHAQIAVNGPARRDLAGRARALVLGRAG